jgi:hypothetical protein
MVLFKKRLYPRGWANYDAANPGTLKLIPPDRVLQAIQKDYVAMREMFFGRCPASKEFLASLARLEGEINEPRTSFPRQIAR